MTIYKPPTQNEWIKAFGAGYRFDCELGTYAPIPLKNKNPCVEKRSVKNVHAA